MRIRQRLLLLPGISAILIASAPAGAPAQEGRISFTHTVKIDIEVPDEIKALGVEIPTHNSTEMQLLFDSSKSVMAPVPDADQERRVQRVGRAGRGGVDIVIMEGTADASMMAAMAASGQGAFIRASGGRGARNGTLVESYVDFEDGSVTEARDFMGRTFLIEDKRPAYEWKLAGEQRELLGYIVQKATTTHDGEPVEAWFTPQIPVQAGPGTFSGLPGLILMVSIDEGNRVYMATEVDLAGLEEGEIRPPEDGNRVSRDEYESIVADKLKELEETRGSRRIIRRPFQ